MHPAEKCGRPDGPKGPWPWIIGGGAALLVVIIAAAVAFIAFGSGGDENKYDSQRTVVTYSVTGSADSVELSYQSGERQEPPVEVKLPWTETVTLVGEDAYFDVSAQTVDGASHDLECRVITYGRTIVEDKTVGEFIGCGGRLDEH